MNLLNNQEAWKYYRTIRPEFRILERYYSKAQHDGHIGATHIISGSFDGKEVEYLTRKSYWYDNCQKFLKYVKLPKEDKHPAKADTIKTDMMNQWESWIKRGKLVTHVTILPDGTIFTFNAQKIIDYVKKYDAYLDHFYGGERGAVFYPLRLANELDQEKKGELDKWF